MILDFSKWSQLNEQQAAAQTDLTPKKFVPSSKDSKITKGIVTYSLNAGGMSLSTLDSTGNAVTCTLDDTGFTVSTRKLGDATQQPQVAKYATVSEAVIGFLKKATSLSIAGELEVTQWGAEVAKLVEQTLKNSPTLDPNVKSGLIALCKAKNFVIDSPTALIDKSFKKGIDTVVPNMTTLG